MMGTTIHDASVHQFMGLRFVLDFGVSIASTGGLIHVVETTHPAFRGTAMAFCTTSWFTSSMLLAIRRKINLRGNISW